MAKSSQEAWKAKKRSEGWRNVLAWLDPDAASGLDSIRASLGLTVNEALSKAVVFAVAHGLLAETDVQGPQAVPAGGAGGAGGPGAAQLAAEVADLRAQLEAGLAEVRALAGRVDLLEPAHKVPVDAPVSEEAKSVALAATPATETPSGKRRFYDRAVLREHVADRIERDGPNFVGTYLYNDLVAQGVDIYPRATTFSNFINSELETINDIVKARRAARAAGGGAR